jgi:hypothetical protein
VQNNVFIAAATRSGSTHIRNTFMRLGLKPAPLNSCEPGYWNEEHMPERSFTELLAPLGGFVFYYHVRAIGRTIPILLDNNITPIVTYRNVLDSMVSWLESHEQGIRDRENGEQFIFLPIHGPSDWKRWNKRQKYSWIAFNVVPWLFSFYVSWSEFRGRKLMVNYRDHYADQEASLNKMVDFLGWDARPTIEQLALATSYRDGKFNKGESGRGRKYIPEDIQAFVYTQAGAWGKWGPELTTKLLEE